MPGNSRGAAQLLQLLHGGMDAFSPTSYIFLSLAYVLRKSARVKPRESREIHENSHTPEVFSQLPNRSVMQKMEERKATMCPSRSSQEQDTGEAQKKTACISIQVIGLEGSFRVDRH